MQEQAGLQEADYEEFETLCLDQDGLALVEYAMMMRKLMQPNRNVLFAKKTWGARNIPGPCGITKPVAIDRSVARNARQNNA